MRNQTFQRKPETARFSQNSTLVEVLPILTNVRGARYPVNTMIAAILPDTPAVILAGLFGMSVRRGG